MLKTQLLKFPDPGKAHPAGPAKHTLELEPSFDTDQDCIAARKLRKVACLTLRRSFFRNPLQQQKLGSLQGSKVFRF